MTKFKISREYHRTDEFTKKIAKGIGMFGYNPSIKRYSDKTKIQSPLIRYSLDEITRWLQNPTGNEQQLRDLSNYLYNTHPTYKLIVRYISLLPTYAYSVIPDTSSGNVDKIKKNYMEVLKYIEKLNLKFELQKASLIAYKNDIFFGYEMETKDSYFIFPLDNRYCRISSIENGVYYFAFDFTYFDTFPNELQLFPEEFQIKYQLYKMNNTLRWQDIEPSNSVCFKTNVDVQYPLPLFAGMFPSIYELEEYKRIKKDRAKNDNYLLLHQRIPMDEKNPDLNKFLIDLDLAAQFHQNASSNLPDGIELVTSPMELSAVKTEKSKNDQDYVNDALREVYNDGGISQFLFNSDKNTSVGLSKSVNTDEQLAFALLRQMETWMNNKLRRKFKNVKFEFINATIFNTKELTDQYLSLAQYGIPVKLEIASLIGLSPLDVVNKAKLENDILGLTDLFVPLQSSHTQSGDSERGRPTTAEDERADSTQNGIDNDTNNRRTEG